MATEMEFGSLKSEFGPLSPVHGEDHRHETKTAAEVRKQNKPLMEKRRRARINESLNKLKALVLDAMKRDTSRYSKLEKADILEMTVKHLRNVQRQQMAVAMANDTTVVGKYRAGFVECASEVSRYLNSIDGLDPQVKNRMLNHLGDCTQKVASITALQENQTLSRQSYLQQHQPQQQMPSHQIPSSTPMSALPGSGYTSMGVSAPPTAGNNHVNGAYQVMSGLPTGGQYALIVPTMDGYRASISPSSVTSHSTYPQDENMRHSYSSTSTSPGHTSPLSTSTRSSHVTSPTSDSVFKFGSTSEQSSSEDEELDVAIDMRVESHQRHHQLRDAPRDINCNIIRPNARPVERTGTKHYPASSSMYMKAPVIQVPVKQEVPTDSMWRPW